MIVVNHNSSLIIDERSEYIRVWNIRLPKALFRIPLEIDRENGIKCDTFFGGTLFGKTLSVITTRFSINQKTFLLRNIGILSGAK